MIGLFGNVWDKVCALGSNGVTQSVLALSSVIATGIMLGKVKLFGISLGGAWILFAGIAFGYFLPSLDGRVLHFVKEFGLILFVYSIGLQVGPGFFSAFRRDGLSLNALALVSIICSTGVAVVLHFAAGLHVPAMVGILSLEILNEAIDGKRMKDVRPSLNRQFVISRIKPHAGGHGTHLVNSDTTLRLHDKILVVTSPTDMKAVSAFFGKETHQEWELPGISMMTWQIVVTKPELQGKTLAELDIRKQLAVSIPG